MHPSDEAVARAGIRTGIGLMFAAMMVTPVVDAIGKWMAAGFSVVFLTWARFYGQALVIGLIIVVKHGPSGLASQFPRTHLLRGALFAMSAGLFVLSIKHLPLAEAVALFFVQPLLVQVLAGVFLGERVGLRRWMPTLIGLCGTMLIIAPGSIAFSPASLLPVCAATFHAGYIVATRAARDTDSVLTMQYMSSLMGMALGSVALGIMLVLDLPVLAGSIDPIDWLGFAALGVLSALAQVLLTAATLRVPASTLAPYGYLEIVAAVILGYIAFGERLGFNAWAGIALILAGGASVGTGRSRHP